mmetsp:Transcript_5189/g.12483  ORF Transcript_5189/g.12483 Transcript_5189/m.12483 type:complete len:167 (-) Transcript_5189:180-680(-)|eukprot:CAMPEP_0173437650 /NCGR_PEP_ID=MMETSP1357-20121228/18142_1 /TAXON_ID=77926 /ORGANISM="Hemiselmis rufescens, Strain PCC563" /LENGTH=166 /DNA_ID=CAMNT_0014402843 /DNA_START=36 /DNA_END=536 /DNA_ORIENTATION=+
MAAEGSKDGDILGFFKGLLGVWCDPRATNEQLAEAGRGDTEPRRHVAFQGNGEGASHAEPKGPDVGVGIVFESTREGDTGLIVASLLDGGPARASRQIQIGDELVAVGGNDVSNKTPTEIAPYMLGPEGSTVTLVFQRKKKQTTVCLRRGFVMQTANEIKVLPGDE